MRPRLAIIEGPCGRLPYAEPYGRSSSLVLCPLVSAGGRLGSRFTGRGKATVIDLRATTASVSAGVMSMIAHEQHAAPPLSAGARCPTRSRPATSKAPAVCDAYGVWLCSLVLCLLFRGSGECGGARLRATTSKEPPAHAGARLPAQDGSPSAPSLSASGHLAHAESCARVNSLVLRPLVGGEGAVAADIQAT
jgi:hypothetical protein